MRREPGTNFIRGRNSAGGLSDIHKALLAKDTQNSKVCGPLPQSCKSQPTHSGPCPVLWPSGDTDACAYSPELGLWQTQGSKYPQGPPLLRAHPERQHGPPSHMPASSTGGSFPADRAKTRSSYNLETAEEPQGVPCRWHQGHIRLVWRTVQPHPPLSSWAVCSLSSRIRRMAPRDLPPICSLLSSQSLGSLTSSSLTPGLWGCWHLSVTILMPLVHSKPPFEGM
ncbi:hypothetical protein P7K49_039374 [Saguinus oedipus]|uniref:Uncharacterized protein n=1 Tax=Saguinus oedipus TaxID=9490 RepID=A0ABQ9TBN6_SAGOE|nr:hypothetical protein P7K49_039374 [Saguinus oedipus]